MRVIIPGGSGLIGLALTRHLCETGHEVIILTRAPERVTGLPAGARAERWDGRPDGAAPAWTELVDGAGAVVNLVGENLSGGRWSEERKRRIVSSRVNAGRAVVQAVAAATRKPGVVLQISGVGYYGPCGDEAVDETDVPGDDFLARVAVAWEGSTAAVREQGVRHVIARSAVVLSREGGAFPIFRLPFRFFVGGVLGSGQQRLPWIHMDDQVAALRFLIEHPDAEGPFNLVAPEVPTHHAFMQALGRRLGRPAWVPVPGFALHLALGELATTVLEGQRPVPQRLLALGFPFQYPTVDGALRDLTKGSG